MKFWKIFISLLTPTVFIFLPYLIGTLVVGHIVDMPETDNKLLIWFAGAVAMTLVILAIAFIIFIISKSIALFISWLNWVKDKED